jgi:MFS family permease
MAVPAPVGAAFVALGMFWGSWAVVIADVQRTFHLSDGGLGTLLAVAIGVAGITGAVAGHRAERWGTGPMLVWSLLIWGVLMIGAALAREWLAFAMLFCATEVGGGWVETAISAAASRRLAGRAGALVRVTPCSTPARSAGRRWPAWSCTSASPGAGSGQAWRWAWPRWPSGPTEPNGRRRPQTLRRHGHPR